MSPAPSPVACSPGDVIGEVIREVTSPQSELQDALDEESSSDESPVADRPKRKRSAIPEDDIKDDPDAFIEVNTFFLILHFLSGRVYSLAKYRPAAIRPLKKGKFECRTQALNLQPVTQKNDFVTVTNMCDTV